MKADKGERSGGMVGRFAGTCKRIWVTVRAETPIGIFAWSCVLVSVLWCVYCACILLCANCDNGETVWTGVTQFGNSFGALSALFSGLAFAGTICAIFMQKADLTLSRKEMVRNDCQRHLEAAYQRFRDIQANVLMLQPFGVPYFLVAANQEEMIMPVPDNRNKAVHLFSAGQLSDSFDLTNISQALQERMSLKMTRVDTTDLTDFTRRFIHRFLFWFVLYADERERAVSAPAGQKGCRVTQQALVSASGVLFMLLNYFAPVQASIMLAVDTFLESGQMFTADETEEFIANVLTLFPEEFRVISGCSIWWGPEAAGNEYRQNVQRCLAECARDEFFGLENQQFEEAFTYFLDESLYPENARPERTEYLLENAVAIYRGEKVYDMTARKLKDNRQP